MTGDKGSSFLSILFKENYTLEREKEREREFSLSYECSSFVILSFADGLGWAKIIRRRSNAVIKKVFRRRMGKFLPCSALLVQIIMVEATAVETCREEG